MNNTLEQYPSGFNTGNLTTTTTSSSTTTKQTVTSRDNAGYNQTINYGSNQDYAPYFLTSLRDQTVREGESVLFEITVYGKNFIEENNFFFIYLFYLFSFTISRNNMG